VIVSRKLNRSKRTTCDLSGPLLVGLLAGDEGAVRRALGEARERGADTAVIARDLVGPALCEVGDMWRRGEVSVAEEHLATALVARSLSQLSASIPAPSIGSPRILFTCLEGEFHDLGIRILSDVAREAGWEAENLGANVPRHAMIEFVAVRRPDALGLSICLAGHVPEAAKTIEQLRAAAPGTKILAGGHALETDPSLCELVPADVTLPDVLALRDWLRENGPKGTPAGKARSRVQAPPSSLPASFRRRLDSPD